MMNSNSITPPLWVTVPTLHYFRNAVVSFHFGQFDDSQYLRLRSRTTSAIKKNIHGHLWRRSAFQYEVLHNKKVTSFILPLDYFPLCHGCHLIILIKHIMEYGHLIIIFSILYVIQTEQWLIGWWVMSHHIFLADWEPNNQALGKLNTDRPSWFPAIGLAHFCRNKADFMRSKFIMLKVNNNLPNLYRNMKGEKLNSWRCNQW